MALHQPRATRWVYCCAQDQRGRRASCDLGEFVAHKADEVAAEALETSLSDADTVIRLVQEGMNRSSLALPSGGELARRLTGLEKRRRRIVDLYEIGEIDRSEFRKRVSGIAGERNALEATMEAAELPAIDESVCIDVAYAFARWARLGRARRRRLLESFGVRFWVEQEGHSRHAFARVVRLEIGALSDAIIFKKLKRLGID